MKRFGRYLSDFQDDTQFIVVTHRKGTMVAADILYGVTMQESGVSKIVSVRMEDINEEAKKSTKRKCRNENDQISSNRFGWYIIK